MTMMYNYFATRMAKRALPPPVAVPRLCPKDRRVVSVANGAAHRQNACIKIHTTALRDALILDCTNSTKSNAIPS